MTRLRRPWRRCIARIGSDSSRPSSDREAGDLPVVGIADRPGPGEFRAAREASNRPQYGPTPPSIGLPGLIDRLDDVVVDAIGLGARDEVAHHHRLLDAAGIGVVHIVAGARPAELGDHDALAGMRAAQLVVDSMVWSTACDASKPSQ